MKTIVYLVLIAFLISCTSQKPAVDFQKIEFYSSRCFGNCPVINFQVKNDRSILLTRTKFGRNKVGAADSKMDTIENLEGKITAQLYRQLLEELSKTDTVSFNGTNCCDAPLKTVIAYYNGKRKYFETMFPPKEGENLISILYEISKSKNLKKTSTKFEFEKDASR